MSNCEREKTNKDNSLNIPEILADFFLNKINNMPLSSGDSDSLYKKKKSKHKRKKHKKSKHRRHSSSSDSTTEINIKNIDDVSSSEEMGIKRLQKIKSIKIQPVNSLILQPTISGSEANNLSNISSYEKPVFYGPSLELLLTGVDGNSGLPSSTNLSLNDFDSDKKKTHENEEENSIQVNSNESLIKELKDVSSSNMSLESHEKNFETKEYFIDNNKENSTHCIATTVSNDVVINEKNFKSNDDSKNDSVSFTENNISKMNTDFSDCKTDVEPHENKPNIIKNDLKIGTEKENSETNIKENNFENDAKVTVENCSETDAVLPDCKNIKLDISVNKLSPVINELDKTVTKKDQLSCSSTTVDEKTKTDINHEKNPNSHVTKLEKHCKKKHSKSHSRSISPIKHSSSRSKAKKNRSRSSSRDSRSKRRQSRSSSRGFRHKRKSRSSSRGSRHKRRQSRSSSRSFKHKRRQSRSSSRSSRHKRRQSRSLSRSSRHKRRQSRSLSRSSRHKRRQSRSLSRDLYHSKKRKNQHSRSRSSSHEKSKSRNYRKRSYSKSYSRSRSRSRYQRNRRKSHSQSPHSRHRHSRSRSYTRSKDKSKLSTRKRSRSKEHHSSSKYSSKSKSRNKSSHSKSRSRSKSQHKLASPKTSRSRSKSKEKKSTSEKNNKIDQAKILETARKNVLQMIKKGTLPEGLPVENLKKEQILSIQSGGKSVQELTDFCHRLSQKENEPETSDNEEKDDTTDDKTGFIHHPFKVKEPTMIKLNIKNAVQLPIKTHAQKVAELSSQFPVSSGNKHKQKELEWIPVVPKSTQAETKSSSVTTVSKVAETNSTTVTSTEAAVPSIPPPPPPPVAITYPSPPPVEIAAVTTSTTILNTVPSTIPMPPAIPPPPLPPSLLPPPPPPPQLPPQMNTVYQTSQPMVQSYPVPNEHLMSYSTISASIPSASVFKPRKKLDIASIVTKRFQALQKLSENPNDVEALNVIQDAQQSIQDWVESQQVPGMFTGSTDAKLLTAAELCGPLKYYKNRKDFLSHAPPVTEGKGMSLLKKMGWNPGEGLGKNKEGSLEPLVLDIKMDKKGLVSEGENSKKGVTSFLKDLQGKHPVSALMELCSKRRWKAPLYTCVLDEGPAHKKLFCFKVEVNGIEYQPVNPCPNKKIAKADAAVLCLQSLNVLPKST